MYLNKRQMSFVCIGELVLLAYAVSVTLALFI
jgi:hypothetical protein